MDSSGMKAQGEAVIGMASSGHSWLFHKWRRSEPIGVGTGMEGGRGYISLCGANFAQGITEMVPSKGDKICKRCFKKG